MTESRVWILLCLCVRVCVSWGGAHSRVCVCVRMCVCVCVRMCVCVCVYVCVGEGYFIKEAHTLRTNSLRNYYQSILTRKH